MRKKVMDFIKKETVFVISAFVTLISVVIVPPSSKYAEYIDFNVLMLLFCLMAVVAGFNETGVFTAISGSMLKKLKTVRSVGLLLVNMCFFSSMLITNDVALITFVPLTVGLFKDNKKALMRLAVIETIAANLGSMLTPIGNPQNLFIYDKYGFSIGEFISSMLPLTVASYVIVSALVLLLPNAELKAADNSSEKLSKTKIAEFSLLFMLCILTVLHVITHWICLCAVCAGMLLFDRKLFVKVDYVLLLTFVMFFVFSGNISSIEQVREWLSAVLKGRELIVSIAVSQVISNVPAAVMLSSFTENSVGLLRGINIGGMGTLVASLASLISYKAYSKSDGAQKGRYILCFTAYGVISAIILVEICCIL